MRSLLPRLVVTVAFAGLMQVACSSDDSSGNGGTGGSGTGGRGGAGGAGTGGAGTGGTGTGGTGTGGAGTGGTGTGGAGTGGAAGSGGSGGAGGTGGTGGGSGGGGGADAAGSETGGADTAPRADGGGEVGGAAKMAVATIATFGGGTITGKVTFVEVPGGIQVTYALENCPPGNHPTHIHDGNGCGSVGAQGMHWDGARGENIGPAGGQITCGADMKGSLTYTRMSSAAANIRWTMGDGAASDVIGHPVVVHGVNNPDQRHGCGVITAAP